MRLRIAFLISVFLIIVFITTIIAEAQELPQNTIIIIGDMRCYACSKLKSFFDSNNIDYVFIGILDCKVYDEYLGIIKFIGIRPAIPLSAVINDKGNITGIVVGAVMDKNFWSDMLKRNSSDIVVVYGEYRRTITNRNTIEGIYQLVVSAYGKATENNCLVIHNITNGENTIIFDSPAERIQTNYDSAIIAIIIVLVSASVLAVILRRR